MENDSNLRQEIGVRLRNVRESQKLTKAEVQRKLKWHGQKLQYAESGELNISLLDALKLAEIYRVSVNSFVDETIKTLPQIDITPDTIKYENKFSIIEEMIKGLTKITPIKISQKLGMPLSTVFDAINDTSRSKYINFIIKLEKTRLLERPVNIVVLGEAE